MPWPVHPTGFFGARGENDTYRIERSLRFNSSDSAYLDRTFGSPTTQNIFTISMWLKLGVLGTTRNIFGVSTNHSFGFTSGDALNLTFAGVSALTTTGLFRDTSAWYHVVWTQNVNAHTIYVNGISVGTATATSNTFNTAVAHQLGAANTTNYFNGYITETHFIDGQALTPASFAETDAITGRWKAKAYGGTYGANGFYLSFKDNTSTTTLGYDDAGSNDWTLYNFSVAAGAGNDSLVDSPTNYGVDTGSGGVVRGNYCVLNYVDRGASSADLSNGNLDATCINSSTYHWAKSTIPIPTTGGWYFEATIQATGSFPVFGLVPITKTSGMSSGNYVGELSSEIGWFGGLNGIYQNGSSILSVPALANGDVIMFAHKEGKTWIGRNGTWLNSGNPSAGTGNIGSTLSGEMCFAVSLRAAPILNLNFGQRAFSHTVPTGFKVICTTNLQQPSIQKPSKYMDVVAYTGTGASNSISSLGFSPDLVWIKNRGTTTSHAIYDTTRGTQAQLSSDTTGDEVTSSTGLTAFGSNGFTVGTSSLVNTSGTQYVALAWDEAPIAGMDIVSYTGNGTNRTIAHSLGVAPKMMIVKARATASTDQGWPVYHTGIASDAETDYLLLNSTAAAADLNTVWNDTAPTSSVFSVGTNALVNTNNDTYIAYLFAEVEGFSKFGSYTGNGSTDGPFVWCGFRPKFVIIKEVATAGAFSWSLWDSSRDAVNIISEPLYANSNVAEATSAIDMLDFVSNGIKIRGTNSGTINYSTGKFIFASFAESPFKYARAR